MTAKIVKRPGADWDIYYMDLDGSRECMSVFGGSTPEEAIAEARYSLNMSAETDEEKDHSNPCRRPAWRQCRCHVRALIVV